MSSLSYLNLRCDMGKKVAPVSVNWENNGLIFCAATTVNIKKYLTAE